MTNKPTSIALSEQETGLLDKYGKKFGLSRSATVRMIINTFFLKDKGSKHA